MKQRHEIKPGWVLLVIIVAFGIVGNIEYRDQQAMEQAAKIPPCTLTLKEAKLAEFFEKNGSPHPVELAQTVAKMKRPRLAAAQAVVESNGNKTAIGKLNEKGVWQIRQELHGEFSSDLGSQSRKFEEVMEQMIRESDGKLKKALSLYNGDRSGKYAALVLRKVAEVKL